MIAQRAPGFGLSLAHPAGAPGHWRQALLLGRVRAESQVWGEASMWLQ